MRRQALDYSKELHGTSSRTTWSRYAAPSISGRTPNSSKLIKSAAPRRRTTWIYGAAAALLAVRPGMALRPAFRTGGSVFDDDLSGSCSYVTRKQGEAPVLPRRRQAAPRHPRRAFTPHLDADAACQSRHHHLPRRSIPTSSTPARFCTYTASSTSSTPANSACRRVHHARPAGWAHLHRHCPHQRRLRDVGVPEETAMLVEHMLLATTVRRSSAAPNCQCSRKRKCWPRSTCWTAKCTKCSTRSKALPLARSPSDSGRWTTARIYRPGHGLLKKGESK